MTIQIAAFGRVPPFAQGYVRDLRVRWALEEAGIPYEAVLIDPKIQASEDYRQWQPFGQVPAYRDGEVEMFESGAIVLHIAAKSEVLAPRDAAGAARVSTWTIAALNSVEPFVQNVAQIDAFHKGEAWTVERRPQAYAFLQRRLAGLAAALSDREWLEGRFTAADILMVTVLREAVDCGVLAELPSLDAYRARGEARPAFQRALEAQLATYRQNAPA